MYIANGLLSSNCRCALVGELKDNPEDEKGLSQKGDVAGHEFHGNQWTDAGGTSFGVTEDKPREQGAMIRQYDNRAEVEPVFSKHEEKYAAKLSGDEKAALMSYTDTGADLNAALREGKADPKDHEAIDAALAKASFPRAAVVTRYIVVDKDADMTALIGKSIQDKAYLSTTLESEAYKPMIEDYVRGSGMENVAVIKLSIEVAKGSQAALLQGVDKNVYSSSEVLLPRDAKIGIRNVYDIKNDFMKVGGLRTIAVRGTYD